MRWADRARLAARLVAATPARSAALAAGLAVAVVLPAGALAVRATLADHVADRVAGAPVVVLAAGDPRGGLISALAFAGSAPPPLPVDADRLVHEPGWGEALGVRTGRSCRGRPLVGVDAGWWAAWGLTVADGRLPALPGEVVAGAAAARALNLAVGDTLQADPAGVVSLEQPPGPPLTLVGVLAPTRLPEGRALLTPLETTWMLDGAIHGAVGAQHRHGDRATLPVSALVVRPTGPAARDLLLAEADARDGLQAVQPAAEVAALADALAPARRALALWAAVGAACVVALLAALVELTLRTRAPERRLLVELGAPPGLVPSLLLLELGLLVLGAVVVAAAVLGATVALA